MDDDTATRFVSSLVKSIQALCNGYIDFSSSIEVIGHIHLNIDRNLKLDYVLTEEVNKSISEGATVFASHSYHSHPPPSLTKTSNENSGRNKKSQQQKDTDTHGSLPTEVPNAGRSVNRFGDSGDSSNSGRSEFDPASVKQEKRSSCQVRDSFERRRRPAPSSHTPSPAAKRSRNNDTSSSAEVIEIKEEFDDEPAVYFGNVAGGGDIQTPDFSNVVMESLDRVSQAEGGSLVPPDGSQQSPFPVMLHSNMPSTSGSVPGQSDPRASTSGGRSMVRRTRHQGYKMYTAVDCNLALQLYHVGHNLREASKKSGVPQTTLFRLIKNCKAHEGPCRGYLARPNLDPNFDEG